MRIRVLAMNRASELVVARMDRSCALWPLFVPGPGSMLSLHPKSTEGALASVRSTLAIDPSALLAERLTGDVIAPGHTD